MQWDNTTHAGFTTGKPWLAVHKNHNVLNVQEQESRPDSVLNYFRKMIQLRKQCDTLIYGAFELIDMNNSQIIAYTRQLDKEKLLVVLNFSDSLAELNTTIDLRNSTILISNYEQTAKDRVYRPYEAVIYQLETSNN